MRLFIDDERDPPAGEWIIARSSDEAKQVVQDFGIPNYISFDHDLGGEDTSMIFLRWFIERVLDGESLPSDFDYSVHSQNPSGKSNITGLMEGFLNEVR